jgi:hypothetical protein
MNLRNTVMSLIAGTALIASAAAGAAAQNTATSSVTIGGGNFTASISASNFATLPYSFTDQTARNGSISVIVSDQTGDQGGWQITVDISDFIGQTRTTEFIPSENLNITNAVIVVAADGSQPISAPNMVPVSGETDPELTWTANPGYGQGAYQLNMTADLLVPGLTSAQTYTSTGVLTIVTGP